MGEMRKNYRLKKVLLCLVIFLVFISVLFMGKNNGNEKREVVLIVKALDNRNDFWMSLMQGAQMAAKEYGIELTILGPKAETMYEEQGLLIEEAIAKNPDAIALTPAHYTETQKYAEKIEAAGIKLVLVDSVMEQTMGVSLVATDNMEAGRKMGEYVKSEISEVSSIGIVGHVKGVSTATEREQGFREGLGELEKNVVDVVFCDSDYRKAYNVTKEMLERYPDINVIVGLNEYSSVGAARAVTDLGMAGKIKMIGFDSSLKEVGYLEGGTFEAIVVQKPLNMGYLCIETVVEVLDKKDVPENVDSGSVLITKETMYTEENQKLLFPL